ncbi:MAG: serine protease [Candidatus Gracilibacteria bacterium]|nr:serine protease [Candidatus Gracilibacteria bacterium]
MNKKIFIISLIFNSILIVGIFIVFFLNQTNNSINNNVVKIVKESEIVKNDDNPKGIFGDEKNLDKNILSGLFINKNTIITAAHGVNNTDSIYEIYDKIGNKYDAKLIKKDTINDYAILEINIDFKNFKKINIEKNINIGEEIYQFGYNETNNDFKMKKGTITKINGNKITTNIVFLEGNSGSPIYNKNNDLIGIAIEVDEKNNVGYFLKISDFVN